MKKLLIHQWSSAGLPLHLAPRKGLIDQHPRPHHSGRQVPWGYSLSNGCRSIQHPPPVPHIPPPLGPPTRGVLSARGVVPACRSLDAVSLFALTAADAGQGPPPQPDNRSIPMGVPWSGISNQIFNPQKNGPKHGMPLELLFVQSRQAVRCSSVLVPATEGARGGERVFRVAAAFDPQEPFSRPLAPPPAPSWSPDGPFRRGPYASTFEPDEPTAHGTGIRTPPLPWMAVGRSAGMGRCSPRDRPVGTATERPQNGRDTLRQVDG